RLARIEAQRAGTSRDERADVAVGLLVDRDGVVDGLGHLLGRQRDFELDGASALVEPGDVLFQLERLARVDADAFEDAVAVEQAVIVDADLGVRFIEELAVDVDLGTGHGAVFAFRATSRDREGALPDGRGSFHFTLLPPRRRMAASKSSPEAP